MSMKERETIGPGIAQILIEGKPFNRVVYRRGKGVEVKQERRVRVVAGYNQATGNTIYESSKNSSYPPSHLPRVSIEEARKADLAYEGRPSLSSIRKRGSSTGGVKEGDLVRARGGDPDFRIRKPDHSFLLGSHPSKLAGTKK